MVKPIWLEHERLEDGHGRLAGRGKGFFAVSFIRLFYMLEEPSCPFAVRLSFMVFVLQPRDVSLPGRHLAASGFALRPVRRSSG